MLIHEVKENSNISVRASKGKKALNFETKALKGMEKGLVVDKIKYGDKLVGFDTKSDISYTVTAVNLQDNKVYCWNDVEIKRVELEDGNVFHIIISERPANTINRRGGYRVYLGERGVIQVGEHSSAYQVLIKDISEHGLSFIDDRDIDISTCGIVHITFEDQSMETKFNLRCAIVRKEPIEERFIYGCRLLGESNKIGKYVAVKQRIQMAEKIKRVRHP